MFVCVCVWLLWSLVRLIDSQYLRMWASSLIRNLIKTLTCLQLFNLSAKQVSVCFLSSIFHVVSVSLSLLLAVVMSHLSFSLSLSIAMVICTLLFPFGLKSFQIIFKNLHHSSQPDWKFLWIGPCQGSLLKQRWLHESCLLWLGYYSNCEWNIRVHVNVAVVFRSLKSSILSFLFLFFSNLHMQSYEGFCVLLKDTSVVRKR